MGHLADFWSDVFFKEETMGYHFKITIGLQSQP